MILITGSTGFVGGHLTRRLMREGLPLRLLVRRSGVCPAEAQEAVGDIADPASLAAAVRGVDTVIHLVGIIREQPGATFQSVHVDGTRNVLSAAVRAHVTRFIYVSALGTGPNARSEYHKTKWQAEELVRASGLRHLILRPSIIYGPGDGFVSMLLGMLRLLPVVPVPGSGQTPMQPIWVGDVAEAIARALADPSLWNSTWEIGGPEQLTYNELLQTVAEVAKVRKPIVHIPIMFVRPATALMQHLPGFPLTSDQLAMLHEPNTCDPDTLPSRFAITPVRFRDGLASYLAPQAT